MTIAHGEDEVSGLVDGIPSGSLQVDLDDKGSKEYYDGSDGGADSWKGGDDESDGGKGGGEGEEDEDEDDDDDQDKRRGGRPQGAHSQAS